MARCVVNGHVLPPRELHPSNLHTPYTSFASEALKLHLRTLIDSPKNCSPPRKAPKLYNTQHVRMYMSQDSLSNKASNSPPTSILNMYVTRLTLVQSFQKIDRSGSFRLPILLLPGLCNSLPNLSMIHFQKLPTFTCEHSNSLPNAPVDSRSFPYLSRSRSIFKIFEKLALKSKGPSSKSYETRV